MLGVPGDIRRCDRWLRRGCDVYLANDASIERALTGMSLASSGGFVVADRIFQTTALAQRPVLLGKLTKREAEILGSLCRGLRNSDIAKALQISGSTVEFHVHHILSKLGARNRTEAVERAIEFGLY
jgi:DNA-binding NarL/FixJ family response regulator